MTMLGKWAQYGWGSSGPSRPVDETTFRLGEIFLRGVDVEDWGCGTGWFQTYAKHSYKGIDGTKTPAVDVVADLVEYRSSSPGIFMRHVLDHNWHWEKILANALRSFDHRLVVVLFTPFSQSPDAPIALNVVNGIPDLSLPREKIVAEFEPFWWASRENLRTATQYGVEHVFFVERP